MGSVEDGFVGDTFFRERNGVKYNVTFNTGDSHDVTVNGVDYIGDCYEGNYKYKLDGRWVKAPADVNYVIHDLWNEVTGARFRQDDNGNYIFKDDGSGEVEEF